MHVHHSLLLSSSVDSDRIVRACKNILGVMEGKCILIFATKIKIFLNLQLRVPGVVHASHSTPIKNSIKK